MEMDHAHTWMDHEDGPWRHIKNEWIGSWTRIMIVSWRRMDGSFYYTATVFSSYATVFSCYATVFTFMHAGIGLVGYTVSAVLSYDGAKQALLPHVVLCFKAAAVPRNTTSTEHKAAHVWDRTEGHGEEWRCTCVVSDSQ